MIVWDEVKLNEVTSLIKRGIAPKYVEVDGYPIINQKCIRGNTVSYEDSKLINKSQRVNKEKYLQDGDVLVNSTGTGTLGRVAQYENIGKNVFCDTHVSIVRANEKIDKDFLAYQLSYKEPMIENYGKGATNQIELASSDLGLLKIQLPPLPTQKKIAKILSNYDDLIENNLRRIRLLEESARLTYEEWFLRFRVDDEKLELDSETGLPFGWERKNLFDIATVAYGYPFKASQFNAEKLGTPIIRIRNIPSSTTKDYTTEIVDDKYIVENGDLLIGMDGEFHINNWTGNRGYLVQRVCNIKAIEKPLFGYLCEAMRGPIKYYEATISGATVAHLGKKHLEEIFIVIPDNNFMKKLDVFNKLLKEKINLSNQNSLLKEARDILLPRLMTGMINVEEMEIAV